MTYHIFLFVYVEWIDFLFWMRTQNRCLGWKGFHSLSHWFTGWALCWSDVGHTASLAVWPGFLVTQGWGLIQQWAGILTTFPFWVKRQIRLQGQQDFLFGHPRDYTPHSLLRRGPHLGSLDVQTCWLGFCLGAAVNSVCQGQSSRCCMSNLLSHRNLISNIQTP